MNTPTRAFNGRLCAGGQWRRIEIDSAEPIQIPMRDGTAFGIASRVRLLDGNDARIFWVAVDSGRLPSNKAEHSKVREWIPRQAVVLATAIVCGNQSIPADGVIFVETRDFAENPQRDDAHAFRRRCRYDVLNVLISCLNRNPPRTHCECSELTDAPTHTRIYTRNDLIDAVRYWSAKGYVSLMNRAGRIAISQTHDDEMMGELSNYSWDEATPAGSAAPMEQPTRTTAEGRYDLFISHASEDKEAVVIPLTDELMKRGLRIWVDYRELRLGDKLRERIDEGLRCTRFGLVILSPRFFVKKWPQAELDGLVSLEMADGRKRILPIWHDVAYDDVVNQSPLLAGRLAVEWSKGIEKVADEIMSALR